MKEPRAPRVERSQHLPSATNDCQASVIERFKLEGNGDLEGAEEMPGDGIVKKGSGLLKKANSCYLLALRIPEKSLIT